MKRLFILATLSTSACSQWWGDVDDVDGDGYTVAAGDCHDADPSLNPGMDEIWYDGIDQNCDGNDLDKDGDGHLAAHYGGDDCWDDPERDDLPLQYTAVEGWASLEAQDVNPSAVETWYDGVDQNCDYLNDFDQDGDGYRTAFYPNHGGIFGEDCIDGSELDIENPAGLDPTEVYPGAQEVFYDGTNADCDLSEAEWGDYDADADGYPAGQYGDWEGVEEDCDDTDSARYPNTADEIWYNCVDENCDGTDGDRDGDGYVTEGYEASCPDWNAFEFFRHKELGDCWDNPDAIPYSFTAVNGFEQLAASAVNPGSEETWYDGVDANCDGADEFDRDQDGHATSSYPNRLGVWGTDCDDEDATVNVDQVEDCATTADDDCNGDANEINALGCVDHFYDGDLDGYGTSTSLCLCEVQDNWAALQSGDCDDNDGQTWPGADEYCDGHDDDCDSEVDEPDAVDAVTWYRDSDYDGYGDDSQTSVACYQSPGYSAEGGDCDDSTASTSPDADEYCDGHDDDCDGQVDENDAVDAQAWYIDADQDGYGSDDSVAIECYQPTGYLGANDDCDDSDANIYPGSTEQENEIDDDCDDMVDEGYRAFGDFFVTEFAAKGTGAQPNGEWFEIHNPSSSDIYLDGVEIESGCASATSDFVVGVGAVVLPAGGYVVFCNNDSVLGNACDYEYGSNLYGTSEAGPTYSSGFCLDDGGDVLQLSLDGTLIDDVDFLSGSGGWKSQVSGVSLLLHSSYYGANSNDTSSNWCYPGSSETIGNSSTYAGNPGAAMTTCNPTFPNNN